MVVGCRLERERRSDVGRRGGMEEELEGKGTLLTFGGIPQFCGTASAPSTFVNVCVCRCVHALGCVFSTSFSTL